jgi:hypothetical protein
MCTSKVRVSIDTDKKYTIIRGLSGVGKTLFINEVNRLSRLKDMGVYGYETDLDVVVINNRSDFNYIKYLVNNSEPVLFIVDANYAAGVIRSIRDINAMCIAVTRNTLRDINLDKDCLYYAYRDNSTNITVIEKEKYQNDNDVF